MAVTVTWGRLEIQARQVVAQSEGLTVGSFVGTSANGGNVTALTTANSAAITWPTVQAGDLAILAWTMQNTATPTDPTSQTFTLLGTVDDGSCRSRILTRKCTGTESGTISGWSNSIQNRQTAVLFVVRGYSRIAGFTSASEPGTSTSHDCPAIGTGDGAVNGDSVIVIGTDRSGATTTATAPSGFAKRTTSEFGLAASGGTYTGIADDGLATAQTFSVDPGSWTAMASGTTSVCWTLALRPNVTATATLASTATTTGTGSVTTSGSASLTGTSTQDATGSVTVSGSGSLTGTAATAADSAVTRGGSAALTGSSTVDADSSVTRSATASLTSTAVTAATAQVVPSGASASLSATSSTAATASTTQSASADLAATATVAATASVTRSATASLAATATATATADIVVEINGSLIGTATVTASGEAQRLGVAAVSAEAVIQTSAAVVHSAEAALVATASTAAEGFSYPTRTHRPDDGTTPREVGSPATTTRPDMGTTNRL